jgi:hypothetical protein
MSIKTATWLAIVAASISLCMSIGGPFLARWLYEHSDWSRDAIEIFQYLYYPILAIVHDGSLLVFFIVLYQRQKAQTPAAT